MELFDSEESKEGVENKLLLDKEKLLLRGAHLRNTDAVFGIIVYSGKRNNFHFFFFLKLIKLVINLVSGTKVALNLKKPPSKRSTLDKEMNNYVFVMFFIFAACVIGFGAAGGGWDVSSVSH